MGNAHEALSRHLQQMIDKVGWAVVAVAPAVDDPNPAAPFAYTVGLTGPPANHPELGMAGLDPALMHELLNDLARRVYDQAQTLAHGQRIGDLLGGGYDVVLVSGGSGEPDRDGLWPGAAYARYGRRRVQLLQVVWPDEAGRFPWEPGCELGPQHQPLIGRLR